jgi:hypothetical protein
MSYPGAMRPILRTAIITEREVLQRAIEMVRAATSQPTQVSVSDVIALLAIELSASKRLTELAAFDTD